MTTTEKILTIFTSKVDNEKEYTRGEMAKMLTEVFKEIKEGSKKKTKKAKKEGNNEEGGVEKKKREPTAYNLYVKETIPVVKEENPYMSRQNLMKEVARMWSEKKEKIVEAKDEIVKDEIVEDEVKIVEEKDEIVEEEVKEEKKGKKGKKGTNV